MILIQHICYGPVHCLRSNFSLAHFNQLVLELQLNSGKMNFPLMIIGWVINLLNIAVLVTGTRGAVISDYFK